MGPLCLGIDVNSLSSARLGKSTPLLITGRVWLGIYVKKTSDEPNCNKKFKYKLLYLDFDVFALYIYIYLRTLHAHLHTTPADTVHTPHTDEWLVASKLFSIAFGNEKSSYSWLLFWSFALLQCEKSRFGCFFFCFRALSLFCVFQKT